MTPEQLVSQIKRHKAVGEFHQAFRLCLDSIKDKSLAVKACAEAYDLVSKTGIGVMEPYSKGRKLPIDFDVDLDWILDIAIEHGFKDLSRSSMSVGFFHTIPCILLEGAMAKHRFGVEKGKDGRCVIYYNHNMFADDYRLIKAICNKVIDLYK